MAENESEAAAVSLVLTERNESCSGGHTRSTCQMKRARYMLLPGALERARLLSEAAPNWPLDGSPNNERPPRKRRLLRTGKAAQRPPNWRLQENNSELSIKWKPVWRPVSNCSNFLGLENRDSQELATCFGVIRKASLESGIFWPVWLARDRDYTAEPR